MIRIWGRPNSICTQRVLWACAEAERAFDLTLASATMGPDGHVSRGGEPFGLVDTESYRAMNPNGTVPTFDDDGTVLWDSVAIVCYVAQKYARQRLYQADNDVFGRALQWMCWTNEHLEPLLHTLVMEVVRLAPEKRNAEALEAARQDVIAKLRLIDRHLAERSYLAGDTFSMGDIPAGATVYRWLLFDLERPVLDNLTDWQKRLQDREAFQQHIEPPSYHLA